MPNQQPTITDTSGKRQFAGSAAAVVVFIVNEEEKLLLLAHPKRAGGWEPVNGALDAGETILEAAFRETAEEAGLDVRVRPLGVVHVYTFRFDDNVQYMISICYLMAYEGGQIQPGNDMTGSAFRWWSLEELADESVRLIVPRDQKWLLKRAIDLYRLWKDDDEDLQPERNPLARTKYSLP